MRQDDPRILRESMGLGCLVATIVLVSSLWALKRFFGNYMVCTGATAVLVWLGVTWLIFQLRRAE
ncbi:MAG: hypothetical protein M1319_05265 [Chloroflexi bacterium]|nr:hypothetical protein [Chloroflexota bacterium]